MLVSIAQAGTVEIVSDSRRMMAIANGLAIAGLPKVLELIKEGAGDPIWNLSEAIQNLVSTNQETRLGVSSRVDNKHEGALE